MPKVIVKNEKGLIAKLDSKALISARGLARLNASMARFDKERPDLAPAARAWAQAGERAANTQTVRQWFAAGDRAILRGDDEKNPLWRESAETPSSQYGSLDAKVWWAPGSFASGSKGRESEELPNASAEALGWTAALELLAQKRKIEEIACLLDIVAPDWAPVSRLKKLLGHLSVEEANASNGLSAADCFAIFLTEEDGYLNDKGEIAPLAGARLFESVAAAQRTIRSQKREKAIVVKIHAQARAVVAETVPESGVGAFGKVLAETEARQLQEALAHASLDQLRQRVSELEGAAGISVAAQNEEAGKAVKPKRI